jgi:hypothetical protein
MKEQLLPIGTKFTFVNDYGIEFEGYEIMSYCKKDDDMYQYGYRYYSNGEAHWMPKKPEHIKAI